MTVDMKVMTLLGVHIFKQDKHSSEKSFIPWSKNTPPPSFLKRVRKIQTKKSKEFLESILDQDLEPNFRPKQLCKCPKIARLSDHQFIQDSKLKMTTTSKESTQDSIPLTVRNMEMQDPKQSRPPKLIRKVNHNSDWSDSEDDQARSKPIDIQDPQPSTSYASESGPLRQTNTFPKVLNLGRGRGKGKFPLANWTRVVKGCGHGLIIDQSSQEPERNLAIVPPTDRMAHTDRVQTYEGDPAPTRPRGPLANWTSVSLGNNPNRPTVDEITQGQLQWNMFSDNNTDNRQEQRHNNSDNRPSDETESIEGDPIYSDEGGSTSGPGLEDVD